VVKRGLGRGLSSLIPSLSADHSGLEQIPVDEIVPNAAQPRRNFDQDALAELVVSIEKHGIIQPIVVRPIDSGFEIVAGERRWRAAKEAGLETLPALVKATEDVASLQLALIENIQREDLGALEEASAYRRLIDEFGLTQAELAEAVGKNRATVANALRLINLSDQVKHLIEERKLSPGHARALLALSDEEQQDALARRVVTKGLSVRQTEELSKLWQLAKDKSGVKNPPPTREMRAAARKIGRLLGSKVRARFVRDKIKVEIELNGLADLHKLEEAICGSQEQER
jgi:ParB family transcriptional regulator, chromosome partitioning protein